MRLLFIVPIHKCKQGKEQNDCLLIINQARKGCSIEESWLSSNRRNFLQLVEFQGQYYSINRFHFDVMKEK